MGPAADALRKHMAKERGDDAEAAAEVPASSSSNPAASSSNPDPEAKQEEDDKPKGDGFGEGMKVGGGTQDGGASFLDRMERNRQQNAESGDNSKRNASNIPIPETDEEKL